MIVFASPVHYFGFSGQLESAIARFFAPFKPKATLSELEAFGASIK